MSHKRSLFIITAASFAVLLAGVLFLFIYRHTIAKGKTGGISILRVAAQFETKPVPQVASEDAADDPAIWIHPVYPDSSRIIGTDKKGGLAVYDLKGNEIFYYSDGEMNNADLRYRFPLKDDTIDILAVSNRTSNSISIYAISRNGSLIKIHKRPITTEMDDEVYGLCMYKSLKSGKYYVFMNNKYGVVEQWELFSSENQVDARIVRKLKLATQVEGMTADDETATLFVGEEDEGIWRFSAEPDGPLEGTLILGSCEKNNTNIKYDIEGLAIYRHGGSGYLIASSQGNDSYAVFRGEVPNEYLGSFRVVDGVTDGTEETDGLDVTNMSLGSTFPHGLLVIQDGSNKDGGNPAPQNFKLVSWDSVAVKFSPPLENR